MVRWITEEDIALVRSWKLMSVDAVNGTDQSADTFWQSVSTDVLGRDVQACKTRWGRIRNLVHHWVNACKRADDARGSGACDEDVEDDARKFCAVLINAQNKSRPKSQHQSGKVTLGQCYDLLKDCPKFSLCKRIGETDPSHTRPEGRRQLKDPLKTYRRQNGFRHRTTFVDDSQYQGPSNRENGF